MSVDEVGNKIRKRNNNTMPFWKNCFVVSRKQGLENIKCPNI